MTQLAEQAASDAQTRDHVPALVERLGRKDGLDSSQREELGRRLESEVVRREIDARIGRFHYFLLAARESQNEDAGLSLA